MNQLRAWLYGHNANNLVEDRRTRDTRLIAEPLLKNEEHLQDGNGQLESTRSSGPEIESVLRSALLRVIPLAPGDCLECKLVGTSVMMLSGVVVILSASAAKRRNKPLIGVNRTVYYLLCGSLFLGFEAAAVCRLFDLGPFEKHLQHSAKKASEQ